MRLSHIHSDTLVETLRIVLKIPPSTYLGHRRRPRYLLMRTSGAMLFIMPSYAGLVPGWIPYGLSTTRASRFPYFCSVLLCRGHSYETAGKIKRRQNKYFPAPSLVNGRLRGLPGRSAVGGFGRCFAGQVKVGILWSLTAPWTQHYSFKGTRIVL
jgi:hypothetical protein